MVELVLSPQRRVSSEIAGARHGNSREGNEELRLKLQIHSTGPKGNRGEDGTGSEVTAAVNLSAVRAVTAAGRYADGSSVDDLNGYAGVTVSAALAGEKVAVTRVGVLDFPGGSFTPNAPVFIGSDGALVQAVTAAPIRRIGFAVTVEKINLDPYPIIQKEL